MYILALFAGFLWDCEAFRNLAAPDEDRVTALEKGVGLNYTLWLGLGLNLFRLPVCQMVRDQALDCTRYFQFSVVIMLP